MKCPNCNSEVKDGLKFCPKCGSEIPKIHFCSKCGAELKDGLRFCPKCGSTLEESNQGEKISNNSNHSNSKLNDITCPICNHPLTIGDKICPNCHRELYYNCNSCGNDITYGEIYKNKGCCPKCGVRINNLYNIPNENYPFASKAYNQSYNEANNQNITVNTNNSTDTGKWVSIAIYCIVLIILGNALSVWGGLVWGIGGALVYFKKWGWKTWKPYVSLFALYIACVLIFGNNSFSSVDPNVRTAIRVALDNRHYECLDVSNIEKLPSTSDFDYKFEANVKIVGTLRKRIAGMVTIDGFGEVDRLVVTDQDLDD